VKAQVAVSTRPCRFCQAPVAQQHAGQVREFCDNRHRAAYRDQERQKALQLASEALDEITDAMEALGAKAAGVKVLLARFHKKKTRKDLTSEKQAP
jgi:Ni,Fe-hydrogenase III large subunit